MDTYWSKRNIHCSYRRGSTENVSKIVTEVIYHNFKSSRQLNYKTKTVSDRAMHSNTETPLNVGLGLYEHQKTQSKNLCNFLYDLKVSIN